MSGSWPVAELEVRQPTRPLRVLPTLAIVVGVLLIGDVAAAATVGGGGSTSTSSSSSGVTSAAAVGAVHAASTKTAATSAKFTGTVTITLPTGSGPLVETITGAADAATHTFEDTTAVDGQAVSTIIAVGSAIYIKALPALQHALHISTPWISIPAALGAAGFAPGISSSALESIATASGTTITKAGTATVDGVGTTRYDLSLNVGRINQQIQGAIKQVLPGGVDVLPGLTMDVLVDGQDLVRQIGENFTENVTVGGKSLASRVAVLITYSDFGAPVHVSAPPADQVTRESSISALLPTPGAAVG